MAKAQDQLDQDQGDEADKNEEEALADLNDAQDELEQTRKEAEEQLAMEQLARMGDQLKSMAERQNKMVTETDAYEKLRLQNQRQAHHRPACRRSRSGPGPGGLEGRDRRA